MPLNDGAEPGDMVRKHHWTDMDLERVLRVTDNRIQWRQMNHGACGQPLGSRMTEVKSSQVNQSIN